MSLYQQIHNSWLLMPWSVAAVFVLICAGVSAWLYAVPKSQKGKTAAAAAIAMSAALLTTHIAIQAGSGRLVLPGRSISEVLSPTANSLVTEFVTQSEFVRDNCGETVKFEAPWYRPPIVSGFLDHTERIFLTIHSSGGEGGEVSCSALIELFGPAAEELRVHKAKLYLNDGSQKEFFDY